MKSQEFMTRLSSALHALPKEEKDAALGYYEEYFNDAADEERAVIELGAPEAVAEELLKEYREQNDAGGKSLARPAGVKAPMSSANRVLLIILLVFASPIWLPLAVSAAGAALSLAVAILAAVFFLFAAVVITLAALFITGIALFAGGLCLIFIGIAAFIRLSLADALFLLGTGMVMGALGAIITALMLWALVKAVPVLVNWFVDICKFPFQSFGRRKTA